MGRPKAAVSALVAVAALATAISSSAAARDADPQLQITVRVDDKAGVQGAVLKLAEARAADVFAMSGVSVDWLDGEEAIRLKLRTPYTILIMSHLRLMIGDL